MSEKILKIIDNVCGCIIITLCITNVIFINTHSNFTANETYVSIYAASQTTISFLFAMHVLIDQLSHKHTNNIQQKGEY